MCSSRKSKMGQWKKPQSPKCADFIPSYWPAGFIMSIARARNVEKTFWCSMFAGLTVGFTFCVDCVGAGLMFGKFVLHFEHIKLYWLPLYTCSSSLLLHCFARFEIRRKYQIDCDKSLWYEIWQTCLCPCGLAQLRAQQSGQPDVQNEPTSATTTQQQTAIVTGDSTNEKAVVEEFEYDDNEIPENSNDFDVFIRHRLLTSRSRYEAADLALSKVIAESLGGGGGKAANSNFDRISSTIGYPSGFPEQWFEEFHSNDNRATTSHLIDTWEAVSKHHQEHRNKKKEKNNSSITPQVMR